VLNPDHPQTELIDLYWALGEDLEAEQRRVLKTGSIEQTALEELLWGPPPRNLAGFRTAIPTPEEVLTYPGRQADWGLRVKLLGLTIEDGLATVNFSQEMKAYGGGSMRVQTIREQITRTLIQFPSVDEVQIAVEGETEGVLQP
jgi:spore germination protein GerM